MLILCLVLLPLCAAGRAPPRATKQPNFVLLFLDDHGFGDFGLNAPFTATTPHMNALASRGVHFLDMHCGASVCTPSRAALLTGRYGARTGIVSNFSPTSLHGLSPNERTLAQILQTVGYKTHMIGKWHLGHHAPHQPTFFGFDDWTGVPYSVDMGCLESTPQGCEARYNRSESQPACNALCSRDAKAQPAVPLYHSRSANCSHRACNDDIVQQPLDPFTLTEMYASRATEIILEHDRTQPFLLYVGFAHTHTPLAYLERTANASQSVFANTLSELDRAIGRIGAAIDDAGVAQETLLVLLADNGPADLGVVACHDIGSVGPYVGQWQRSASGGRGGSTAKGTTWEGGHRVSSFAKWDGTIAAGQTSRELVSALDIVPTFASLAGASLPTDRSFDGVDLSSLLTGTDTLRERVLFHPDTEGQLNAMRYGDLKVFFETYGNEPCRKEDGSHDPSGVRLTHDPPLVFNVTADPAESQPIVVDNATLARIVSVRNGKRRDIETTLRSVADYSTGGRNAWACCNPENDACQCDGV